MRTLNQFQRFFRTHEMRPDYRYQFFIGGTPVKRENSWGGIRVDYDNKELIGGDLEQSVYCCGVYEFGNISTPNKFVEEWKAIIEYMLIKEKLEYLRVETLTAPKDYKALEEALVACGFRLVTTINSRHAKRAIRDPKKRYKINIWEWLKPKDVQS